METGRNYSSTLPDYKAVTRRNIRETVQAEQTSGLFDSRIFTKSSQTQHLLPAKIDYKVVKPVEWTTTFNEESTLTATKRYVHQTIGESGVRTETVVTNPGNGPTTTKKFSGFQIGIYGWRKRCLYLLLVLLACIMILNFYITLWFIGCLRINSEGIGAMKIFDTGIMIDGVTYFMDSLVTSKIQAQPGKPLSMVTSDKFTVTIRDPQGREISKFNLSNDSVEFITKALNVKNENGEIMFSVDNERVRYGAKEIKITGTNGAFVNKAIQTPLIKGHSKDDLSLLSIHRNIEVIGSSGVLLKAPAGDISLSCLTGVLIRATDGFIKMDSRRIFMPNLPIANRTKTGCSDPVYSPTITTTAAGRTTDQTDEEFREYYQKIYTGVNSNAKSVHPQMVYQVCMCANGKMFLAFANGECTTDNESDICR